ncbi:MAG: STAS domain-containing protein [Phycisphaerales bacterium]|nr:STAS domain-containing protein [Phycisphaerales bacterium]
MSQSSFVTHNLVGNVVVAQLEREKITEHECQVILTELTNAAAKCQHHLAVDLSKVTLIASAGLGALITLNKTIKAKGGKVVFFAMSEELLQVFKLTRLNTLLTIVKDKDAAVKAAL